MQAFGCHGSAAPPAGQAGADTVASGMVIAWRTSEPYIFFPFWTATTPETFWISVGIIFLLAAVFEVFVYYRSVVEKHYEDQLDESSIHYEVKRSRRVGIKVLMAFIYMLYVALAYLLMMIFMMYNTYFIIAMLAGFFVGHLGILLAAPRFSASKQPGVCH